MDTAHINELSDDALKEIITENCVETVGALYLLKSTDFESEVSFKGKTYKISIVASVEQENARTIH